MRVARRSPIMLPWCGPGVVSRHAKTTHPLLIGTSALSTAETAARELGTLSLSDALSLCRLYERDRDPWSERAIRRWISRMRRECALRHEQVGLLVVAAGLLRTEFRQLALNVLLTARGELRRAAPTLRRSRPVRLWSVPTRMAKDSTGVATLA